MATGLVLSALLVLFFLLVGNKKDTVSLLAVGIAVVVIMFVCTHWDSMDQYIHALETVGSRTAQAVAAPTFTPTPAHSAIAHVAVTQVTQPTAVATAKPTPVVTVPATASSAVESMSLMSGYCIDGIIGLAVIIFVLVSVTRRPRRAIRRVSGGASICPECHQEAELEEFRYYKGSARVTGKICSACAVKLSAAASV